MTQARVYAAKPLRIKALQWDGTEEGAKIVGDWLDEDEEKSNPVSEWTPQEQKVCVDKVARTQYLRIKYRGHVIYLAPHDWLIQDSCGRFQGCNNGAFHDTYNELP